MTEAILRMPARTFASVHRHRNYRLFFAGQIVSTSGTWMQKVAQAWLILRLTHSPMAVGVLALCQFLPFTLFGLFAGVIVDRLDARRVVLATQAVSMALSAALAGLALTGAVTALHVYVIAALAGTVLVLDAPARHALTYQLVGRRELPNAIALNSSVFNASRILGPAAGGLVIAAVGVGWCFAVNAVSFLAVLAGLLLMRTDELHPLVRHERPPILGGIREGFAYARSSRQTMLILGTVLVLGTFAFNFNVLLPVLASQTLHARAEVFGAIFASFGAGALVGALLAASLGRASMKVLLLGTGGFGLAELLLAPVSSLPVAALLLFLTGLSFTLWTANSNTTIQLEAPDHMRGRVLGLYFYAFNGTGPLGGFLAGWLCERGGTELAFGVAGAVALATTAAGLALDKRPARRHARMAEPAPERLAA